MIESPIKVDCPIEMPCKSANWTWEVSTGIITFSDNWKKMLGYKPEEIGSSISEWIDRIHPQERFLTLKFLTSLRKNLNIYFDFYYRIKNKSNHFCWKNCYGYASEFNDDNTPKIITGIQQDVDELKTSEEYFKEVNLRFGALTENYGGGILLENEDRKIFFINQQFCDFFSIPVPPQQLLGSDCSDAAENSKHLFEDPGLFVEEIAAILKNKVTVRGDVCKMKNGLILERDYIPVFDDFKYKGHLWIYRDITHFKVNEDKLEFRLRFEELVIQLSSKFISLSWEDIDTEIDEALGLIGKFISADRSYVFLFEDGNKIMNNTHEWVNDGITPEKENLKNIPTDIFPWWMEKLMNHQHILIPSVKDLPEEAATVKEILEPQGIKSLIAVPLIYSNNVLGYIGFDAVSEYRSWDYDSVKLLSMSSSVIADAIKRKENETSLIKSESQYRTVVNSVKEVIFQTDREGNWVFLNPAWTEITNYTVEESLGKNFSNFLHPDEVKNNLERLQFLLSVSLEHSLQDVIFIIKNGSPKLCEVYVKSLLDENNQIIGITGTIRDISQQRKSEQEIKKLTRAIETIETGILLSDFKGIISYVNPGLLNTFGFKSQTQIVGHSIFSLTSNEGSKVLKDAIITRLMSGHNWKGEIELRKLNGKYFPAEAICSVVHDDKNHPLYVVANFYDITERNKAEVEVRNSLIKERELSEMKTKFVSMVSHEFRTPLAAIQSSSDLIELYWDKLTEDKRTALLAKIKVSVKNLIEILTDVTEINRVESGKATANYEDIEITKLVKSLIEEVKQAFPERPAINYEQKIDTLIFKSDKKLLRQIFINLISNAVKYTPVNKNIYITLDRLPDLTVFMVSDEGIGIPEEDFNTLFEPFMRSKNIGKIKGTGLGLSILKRAVDLLGGRVDFSSQIDKGSTFTVYLPDPFIQTTQDEKSND